MSPSPRVWGELSQLDHSKGVPPVDLSVYTMGRHLCLAWRLWLVSILLASTLVDLLYPSHSLSFHVQAAPLDSVIESELDRSHESTPVDSPPCLRASLTGAEEAEVISDVSATEPDEKQMPDNVSARKVATFAGALGGTFGVLSVGSSVLSLLVFLRKRREKAKADSARRESQAQREDEEDDIDGMSTRPVPAAEMTLHRNHPLDIRVISEISSSHPPPYTVSGPSTLYTVYNEDMREHSTISRTESLPTFAEAIASPIPPLLANLRMSTTRT